ncbi:MAG: ABC transporter permease [Planctomycetes bacterium]|nr:ABC transporter permease [Planctomycetota bacterium]
MNPMFERDFVGFAQKKRFFVLRTGIVAAPVLGLITLAIFSSDRNTDELGGSIFTFTTYPLLVLALLIAPSLLAHSIVLERKLNTIEVLRTTSLTSWRIVWGKWFGRTLLLLLVCVAALPLAASSLLFGGIAPMQILYFVIILFGSVLWATSLAVFVSCIAKDVTSSMRTSVVLVLFGLIGTAVVAMLLGVLMHSLNMKEDYAALLLYANPVAVLIFVQEPRTVARLGFTSISPALIYGGLSLMATTLFLLWSTRLIARDAKRPFMAETNAPVAVAAMQGVVPGGVIQPLQVRPNARRRWLPSWLDRAPLVWLEVNQVTGRRKKWMTVLTVLVLVLLELGFVYGLGEAWRADRDLARNARNTWGFHASAAGAFLFMTFLGVMSMGAAAFRRDNDAKTLEALYATPLTSDEMARGKVAGVFFSALPPFIMAQLHALAALALTAIHPIAWLWWVVASTTTVMAAAAFSIWVGLRAKSLLQANLLAMGGFALWMIVLPIGISVIVGMAMSGGSDSEFFLNLALGWHPLYVGLAPFFAGAPKMDFVEDVTGWWMTIVYLIVYGAVAAQLFLRAIPGSFRGIREGYEWQRSPIK